MQITIVKSDGTTAGPMAQPQAESYLYNLINNVQRLASLKQAMNDVTNPAKGKSTQPYMFGGNAILHASSGDGETSVSLFFYRLGGVAYIVAMGEHAGKVKGKETYKLVHYGQTNSPLLKKNATVTLT